MIEKCIENWHRQIRGEFPGGLDELLADDVVFYSPIVFTPQKGKEITKLYLGAAASTFTDGAKAGGAPSLEGSKFRYTKQVLSGNQAILEFESEVDGVVVNGVDILTVDEEGRIVEFKVMLRPLKAIELMHAKMRDALAQLSDGSATTG